MPPPPLDLRYQAELVRIIKDAAAPLLPGSRSKFYARVGALLHEERELGPGAVARCCRRAQAELLAIPDAKAIDGTA
jgi:hypothetical protein